jgi:hypothetical protein
MMNIEAIYKGGPCPPYMSGPHVLGILKNPLFIRKIFGGTGFQPVQAQAKACGYILEDFALPVPINVRAGKGYEGERAKPMQVQVFFRKKGQAPFSTGKVQYCLVKLYLLRNSRQNREKIFFLDAATPLVL